MRASLPALAHEMPWCTEGYALEDAAAWITFAHDALVYSLTPDDARRWRIE